MSTEANGNKHTMAQLREADKEPAEHADPLAAYRKIPGAIEAFAASLPPPEDLEGYRLEWRMPMLSDEWWDGIAWRIGVALLMPPCLVRVPLEPEKQYLEGDQITDELLQHLGRLACDVLHGNVWESAELMKVSSCDHISTASTIASGGVACQHCRIPYDEIRRAYDRLGNDARAEALQAVPVLRDIVPWSAGVSCLVSHDIFQVLKERDGDA